MKTTRRGSRPAGQPALRGRRRPQPDVPRRTFLKTIGVGTAVLVHVAGDLAGDLVRHGLRSLAPPAPASAVITPVTGRLVAEVGTVTLKASAVVTRIGKAAGMATARAEGEAIMRDPATAV